MKLPNINLKYFSMLPDKLKQLGLIAFFICASLTIHAQLHGVVTENDGKALAYASIYVQGTTIGTTSNEQGEYFLNLEDGNYVIVCEYLGYGAVEKQISIKSNERSVLNFHLTSSAIHLEMLNISADREDPAYAVIRQAQAHRKDNLKVDLPQSCEMYMKGNIALGESPDKFMGVSMDELRASIDSMGTNIMYLSETVSTLYRAETGLQEVIHSSRVSGSSMYSFNRGAMVEYSVYERSLNSPLGSLINPIGPSAFTYYEFRLLSKDITNKGTVNTISVKSKNTSEPTIDGIIYISEEAWQVDAFDFTTTGKRLKQEILDTVRLQQEYIKAGDRKVLFKNRMDMQIGLLGFTVDGVFLSVYTDYEFGEAAVSGISKRQAVTFQDSSETRNTEYWDGVRPVKLSELESKDYHVKDSISIVINSPEYRDSIERISNKYNLMNLLTGYTFRKSAYGFRASHDGLGVGLSFDPVRGFALPFDLSFTFKNRFTINGGISYGFSDELIRYNAGVSYKINPNRNQSISFATGTKIADVNSIEPFTRGINEFMSLLFHQNLIKYHGQEYYRLDYQQRIIPGLNLKAHSEYVIRNHLQNTTEYSFLYKKRLYKDNMIDMGENLNHGGLDNRLFKVTFNVDYFPGTRFTKYPSGEIRTYQPKYNKFSLTYDMGIPVFNTSVEYQKFKLAYSSRIRGGFGMDGSLHASVDFFLGRRNPGIQDFIWMNDNGSIYTNAFDISQRFLGMDTYEYFTDQYAMQLHYYHNFEGMILNKVPGLNKLGWNLTAKYSAVYMPEMPLYMEVGLGIDRIGWKLFRPLRFDVVLPSKDFKIEKLRYVIGMKIDLGALSRGEISF